jgi:hypothetical protein
VSFEGYYQCVCKNGHYFEIDVYDDRDKCVDCFQDLIFKNTVDETNCETAGYIRIPINKSGDVEKKFFDKYFSTKEKIDRFKERKYKLPCLDNYKRGMPLEKLIDLFQYFDKNKTLRVEFKLDKDAGGETVPYVIATFGFYNYDRSSDDYMQWQTMYIDDYGQENLDQIGYECFEMCYDADVYYVVFELYKNMWNRCFKYGFKE